MAISKEQRAALEAKGYTIGRSGNTVQNSKGETVGGFNENGQVFSGNSSVRDILKSKPTPAAPKPAAKPAARRPAAPAPAPAPKPQPKRPVTPTPAPKPKATGTPSRTGVNRSGAPGTIKTAPQQPARPISRTPESARRNQEMPVPGRAIFRAIRNAFTGEGETDAAKVTSRGYAKGGRVKPKGKK